ncbi:DUF3604 domain-containing protein [Roseovarius faecimaris]|uniref:DUF3604 domain-containing protein n=1 Tax=Roseovarius faecimaris TaxID=2494550 RepID=A0A6I6IVG7_9RHOB|nr:DUF3604 domain-containing protein [Roseovarius faecimaris]QGX99913.1 DUF3604 domain-containing protein [Roseovarius faecimaris]
MPPIRDDLMGDVWPLAQPGADGADYGAVSLAPLGSFQVRSFQRFTLTYRVGEYGLDDTGAIKIVQRWTSDAGPVQFDDPQAMNHVRAEASNGVELELHAERYPHQRPWYNGIRLTVKRGYMRPGDTITVHFGGTPGYRLQTFCESAFEFRVLADPCATGTFIPVGSPAIEIVAGPPARWVLVAPTLRRPGEGFALGIRAEDAWGNACVLPDTPLALSSEMEMPDLPGEVRADPGTRGLRIEGLSIDHEGATTFTLSTASGEVLARSNPLLIQDSPHAAHWGDLHGQSGETVGIDTVEDYIAFARDVSFLDVTSHQANDFQIKPAFWDEINRVTAAYDDPGRFTVFPGYEWSGNTPVGGDHNVFFRNEGEVMHRSSRALLHEREDMQTDAPTLTHLFDHLQGRDCVVYAHIGGRPADISYAHDPALRTAVEVHSDWGTFEWLMTDAFALGHRVGLVCNSDGHKGAPGMTYPGATEFGAYTGLTCFLTDRLDREAIFDAMRRRHHYGTTGCRMHLEVEADLGAQGVIHDTDPAHTDAASRPSATAIMGDIARSQTGEVPLRIRCHAHAPILRIDVLNGAETVQTLRPYAEADLGDRLRLTWQGALYRGRGRQVFWQGEARLDAARIADMRAFNAWNLERQTVLQDPRTVRIDAVTTGNFGGVDLWLDDGSAGQIAIDTGLANGQFALSDIGLEDTVIDAGGLDRKLRLCRLPDQLTDCRMDETVTIPLIAGKDNPLWVRVTTEDGFNAWSSPIYLIP